MILAAEITMIVLGLIGLIAGKYPVGKGRSVTGIPARFLGLIAMLPIPVAIAAIFFTYYVCGTLGIDIPVDARYPVGVIIELLVVVGFFALLAVLSQRWSEPASIVLLGEVGQTDVDSKMVAKPAGIGDEVDPVDEWMLSEPPQTSGKARATLMLGVFSLLTSVVGSIPAFILGTLALAEIERSGGRIIGKGLAMAGIILGSIGIFTGFIALTLLLPLLRKMGDPGPDAVATAPIIVPAVRPPAPLVVNPRANPPTPPRAVATPTPPTKSARAKGGFNRSDDAPKPTLAINTKPIATMVPLASKPRTVGDLKVTDLKVKPKLIPRCLVWGDDGGTVVFILETDGTLRKVKLDGFREELKWEIGQKCSWLSLSSEGLVLVVEGLQEVWLLDPSTFAIRSRTAAASVTRAWSSTGLSIALATNKPGDTLALINLKAGKIVREYDTRSFPGHNVGFDKLAITPDGKSVFSEGSERIVRLGLDGDELTFEEESDRIGQNSRAIELSADGAYVALPSGGGNYKEPPYTTNVYRTSDLSKPEIRITSGAYPECLGFDLKGGFLYAQNFDESLILFQPSGTKAKSYKLAGPRSRGNTTRQFLVHPDGGKFFALTDQALAFVERPEPK